MSVESMSKTERQPRTVVLVASMVAMLWISGCGGAPAAVTVTGSILQGAKPVSLSPTGVVQVTLVPDVNAEFTSYLGRCDETGKFVVEQVPPGRYRICIEVLDPSPQEDKLQGAYSMHNTKIIRDIDGKTPVVVDLAQPAL